MNTYYRTDGAGRRIGLDWQMHGGLENPEDDPSNTTTLAVDWQKTAGGGAA